MSKYNLRLDDPVIEEEIPEKVNLHEIQATLKGLSDKLQGINFILQNNSLYLIAQSDMEDFKRLLKENFTYLHYLTEVEHSKIYIEFGHNRILLTSSDLNKLTD